MTAQTVYRENPDIGIAGQVSSELYNATIRTGIAPGGPAGPEVDMDYVDGFAAADTLTFTLEEIPIVATLVTGDDTIEEARDRQLAALAGSSWFRKHMTAKPVGVGATSQIRMIGKVKGKALSFASSEVTAGLGEANHTEVVAPSATDGLVFGSGVNKDLTDATGRAVIVPAATGGTFRGIVVRSEAHGIPDVAGDAGVAPSDPFNVLEKGDAFVRVEEAVALTDNVFLRHTVSTGGDLLPGGWRTDADTAKADQITTAEWIRAAGPGEIAILRLN